MRALYPSIGEPDLDLSPFRDEPGYHGDDDGFEPITVNVGCTDITHPLRVGVTVTSPDQEVCCTVCGSRMWRYAEKLDRLFSEVCCHLRVDGTTMWGVLTDSGIMVQLYDLDGKPVSFPITTGEAGWPHR